MTSLGHEQPSTWSMSVDQWIPVSAECKTWYCNKSSNVRLPKQFCPDDIYFLFLTPLPSAAQSSLLWSWLQNQTATTDFQTGTLRSLSNGPCSHQQWSILKLRSLSNGPCSHQQLSISVTVHTVVDSGPSHSGIQDKVGVDNEDGVFLPDQGLLTMLLRRLQSHLLQLNQHVVLVTHTIT